MDDDEIEVKDEDLEPQPTLQDSIEALITLSGQILEVARGTTAEQEVNTLTEKMDLILIDMRHGIWFPVVG